MNTDYSFYSHVILVSFFCSVSGISIEGINGENNKKADVIVCNSVELNHLNETGVAESLSNLYDEETDIDCVVSD